jgi:hypothetical protein
MANIGIQLNGEFDLEVAHGSLAVGNTDEQALKLLFLLAPGELKGSPTVGVGISAMQHGAADRFFDGHVRVQLAAAGFKVKTLSITEAGVEVDGQFKE